MKKNLAIKTKLLQMAFKRKNAQAVMYTIKKDKTKIKRRKI